jgi:hypothetical protein
MARMVPVPARRDDLGPFYQDMIAVDPLAPWEAPSAVCRLELLARTLRFPVDGARLVPSNNNDVWRLPLVGARRAGRPAAPPRREPRPAAPRGRRARAASPFVSARPADRPADAGLDPAHPLHTLRRLADAPLPLPVQGR